jgi:serine/threonine-protein kinase HipA
VDAFIEIHQDGTWQRAARLRSLGDHQCQVEYLAGYLFGDRPTALSLSFPLQHGSPPPLEDGTPDLRVPPFLYDMVPQGRGRRFLIDLLQVRDSGDRFVMPLLLNGAINPIGCLRIDTAVEFYRQQSQRNPERGALDGFGLEDIQARTEGFLEHMALHAMLAAGTTGVQGVAPKYLLTQDQAGRWFADLGLPDERASAHWLVKLPRGRTAEDLRVHRNEAAYLRLAAACGVRVLEEPHLVGSMLFVRRFDRQVRKGGGVVRLHQESLSSLVGMRGFGQASSQNALLAAMRRHVSDPFAQTLEFMKRDVLNLALRNTDNHARNTAVQRLPDGTVQLTPLFDFGPMFLDPEVVPRTMHWRDAGGARLDDWLQVFATLDMADDERIELARKLARFADTVASIPSIAADHGIDAFVLDQCRASIDDQAEQLRALGDAVGP